MGIFLQLFGCGGKTGFKPVLKCLLPNFVAETADFLFGQFFLKGKQRVEVDLQQSGKRGQKGDVRIGDSGIT